jgi:hypothetical protein
MSTEQHAVLWLGFLLILVRMLTGGDWSSIWGTLKNGTPTATTQVANTPPNISNLVNNGINVPGVTATPARSPAVPQQTTTLTSATTSGLI